MPSPKIYSFQKIPKQGADNAYTICPGKSIEIPLCVQVKKKGQVLTSVSLNLSAINEIPPPELEPEVNLDWDLRRDNKSIIEGPQNFIRFPQVPSPTSGPLEANLGFSVVDTKAHKGEATYTLILTNNSLSTIGVDYLTFIITA